MMVSKTKTHKKSQANNLKTRTKTQNNMVKLLCQFNKTDNKTAYNLPSVPIPFKLAEYYV